MSEDFDRNKLHGLLQTGLDVSLGAAHKSIEMARNPPESAAKVLNEMMSMFTLPAHTGPQLQDKAQAIAGLWMEKGLTLFAELKMTGEKVAQNAKPAQPVNPEEKS